MLTDANQDYLRNFGGLSVRHAAARARVPALLQANLPPDDGKGRQTSTRADVTAYNPGGGGIEGGLVGAGPYSNVPLTPYTGTPGTLQNPISLAMGPNSDYHYGQTIPIGNGGYGQFHDYGPGVDPHAYDVAVGGPYAGFKDSMPQGYFSGGPAIPGEPSQAARDNIQPTNSGMSQSESNWRSAGGKIGGAAGVVAGVTSGAPLLAVPGAKLGSKLGGSIGGLLYRLFGGGGNQQQSGGGQYAPIAYVDQNGIASGGTNGPLGSIYGVTNVDGKNAPIYNGGPVANQKQPAANIALGYQSPGALLSGRPAGPNMGTSGVSGMGGYDAAGQYHGAYGTGSRFGEGQSHGPGIGFGFAGAVGAPNPADPSFGLEINDLNLPPSATAGLARMAIAPRGGVRFGRP